MRIIPLLITATLLSVSCTFADSVESAITTALEGMAHKSSKTPYSKRIEQMVFGYDASGEIKVGIAHRKMASLDDLSAIVIIHYSDGGFTLHETIVPELSKIKEAKSRRQAKKLLAKFQDQMFDPHAEKSAVDAISGATQHGINVAGYLNYMARKTALEMEKGPDWIRSPVLSD